MLHDIAKPAKGEDKIVARAAEAGFSKLDLIDAGTALARLLAQAYADAIAHQGRIPGSRWSRHVVTLMVFDGREVTDDVREAIRDIASIANCPGRLRREQLAKLGSLLFYHGQVTRSSPMGTPLLRHQNDVTDLGLNLSVIFGETEMLKRDETVVADLLTNTLERLAGIMGDLWS